VAFLRANLLAEGSANLILRCIGGLANSGGRPPPPFFSQSPERIELRLVPPLV
jgi:hypothetical protein